MAAKKRKRNSAASSARRKGRTAGSVRKHKNSMKAGGFSGSDIQYVRSLPKRRKRPGKRSAQNPTVYDSAGKAVGKFKRKAAKLVARVVSGTVGKPKPLKNPRTMRFRTKAAMLDYAALHGYKVQSIRKAPR